MHEVCSLPNDTTFLGTAPIDTEKGLVKRLIRRDDSAFQELIDLHGPPIRNLIGRLMAYDPEMEDVFQMTLVQVWRKIGSFRSESSLRTWITRIAILQTRNHQRSVRRWFRRIHEQWNIGTFSPQNAADKSAMEDPRWELMQAAMKQLPHRDREILVMVYLEGISVQELARLTGERPNTLEVRLLRAKKQLRHTIDEATNQ